jgi:hypothetical protein
VTDLAMPTYQQDTVKEVARALSGWTYPSVPGAPYRSTNNQTDGPREKGNQLEGRKARTGRASGDRGAGQRLIDTLRVIDAGHTQHRTERPRAEDVRWHGPGLWRYARGSLKSRRGHG